MKTIPKNILHADNLGKDIIRKLSQYGELPQKGFLAGGAVANTILSMEWCGDYPINDLDIFRIESTDGLKSTRMPYRFMDMNLCTHSYHRKIHLWVDHKNAYTVSKVARNGLLNIVDVQLAENNQNAENYKNILKGFDLNCCQVGIDLENEKVICSAEFGFFLETAQLQVDHPCTPFHTAIRIVKKRKELHCYCDESAEFKYLSQVPLLLSSRKCSSEIRNIEYAKYFGKDNYNLYLQYHEELDKYFEVKKISNANAAVELFTMVPRDSTVIDEFRGCYNLDIIKATRKLLQGKKTTRNKNIRILKRDDLSKDFLLANPNYAQCDWDERHIQQIHEFLNHHAYMAIVFDQLKLNIQEQLTAVRTIKRMADKEGLYVIG